LVREKHPSELTTSTQAQTAKALLTGNNDDPSSRDHWPAGCRNRAGHSRHYCKEQMGN
jgi:hypothetical protein